VILKRTLKVTVPKMAGNDVEALQRELNVKGWKLPVTGTYGNTTADLVLKAKKKIPGYPKEYINRKAGPLFARELTAYHPSTPRSRFVDLFDWGVAHEPAIHYLTGGVSRPVRIDRPIYSLPISTDCTGIGILFADWAGLHLDTPAGSGEGRTSTFVAHLKHITKAQLKPGDPIVFGDYHACYFRKAGADPELFSHGTEGGPKWVSLSAETAVQERMHGRQPIYFLSLGVD
jgi:hypothetical protein